MVIWIVTYLRDLHNRIDYVTVKCNIILVIILLL